MVNCLPLFCIDVGSASDVSVVLKLLYSGLKYVSQVKVSVSVYSFAHNKIL